jgi:hypothetical protein
MVHYLTTSGLHLTSYGHRNLVGLLNSRKSRQTWPSGINQDSDEILPWPPQKLCIWKAPLMNTSSRWLLIRPISTHGLVTTGFWIRVKVLNYFGQLGHWKEILALGAKMSESRLGLVTDSVAYFPSSSMPTQTDDFSNHRNGYGRSRTALARS